MFISMTLAMNTAYQSRGIIGDYIGKQDRLDVGIVTPHCGGVVNDGGTQHVT